MVEQHQSVAGRGRWGAGAGTGGERRQGKEAQREEGGREHHVLDDETTTTMMMGEKNVFAIARVESKTNASKKEMRKYAGC